MLEEQICRPPLFIAMHCDADPSLHHPLPACPDNNGCTKRWEILLACPPLTGRLPLVIFKLCRIALTLANFWNATNISPAEANIRIIFMTHGIQSLESLDFIKPKLSNYYMNYNIYTHRGHPDWPEWRSGLASLKRNSAMQKHRLQNFINSHPPSFVTW